MTKELSKLFLSHDTEAVENVFDTLDSSSSFIARLLYPAPPVTKWKPQSRETVSKFKFSKRCHDLCQAALTHSSPATPSLPP